MRFVNHQGFHASLGKIVSDGTPDNPPTDNDDISVISIQVSLHFTPKLQQFSLAHHWVACQSHLPNANLTTYTHFRMHLFRHCRLHLEISADSVYNYYEHHKANYLKFGGAGKIDRNKSLAQHERFFIK